MTNCFVCGGKMNEYFIKHESYEVFGKSLDRKFIRCENCGLVIDQTSYNMTPEEHAEVNDKFVLQVYENAAENEVASIRRTNRVRQQALFVYQVLRTGIIGTRGRVVDYGCADGKLAGYVAELKSEGGSNQPNILLYDRFYQKSWGGVHS